MKKQIHATDSLFQVADRIELLLVEASDCIQQHDAQATAYLDQTADALEFLPLATGEFNLAKLRLSNCAKYLCAGEWGASQYELSLAVRWFQNRSSDFKN